MKGKQLILTYDVGTTGNKCTLFDSEGKQLYTQTVAYKTYYPKPGWSEQDPEDFWKSAIEGTRALLMENPVNPSDIAVIGLSGHMNGCIPMDREGKALFFDIIHSDCRSHEECREIAKVMDGKEFYRITGNRIDPHYTLPKILWLKKVYPDIYNATAYFINSKDFLSYKLTNKLGMTDFSDASLTCMLDIRKKAWAEDMINELGIDKEKLPRLMRSVDIAGYLCPEAASVLGIPSGIPVVVGGGDGACSTRGAGVMGKGQAYNYIGSSSWIDVLNDAPILDEQARIFNYYDLDGQSCNVCGTVQSATISYDWVIENFGRHELEWAKAQGSSVFDLIEGEASKSPCGSNGVFFLPYLMGERTPFWDNNTRGGFIGITLYHQKSDLFRAVYEGVAYALRSVLDVFDDNHLTVDSLTLIGGGAKSRLWNEIMGDVYGKPVKVHRFPSQATSLGTAMAAGVGIGIFKDLQSAKDVIQYDREYTPDSKRMEEYKQYYDIYKMMYPRLKPIYDEIAKLS